MCIAVKQSWHLFLVQNNRGKGDTNLDRLSRLERLGTDLEDFDETEFDIVADDDENIGDDAKHSISKEENLNPRSVILDPIFKAQPLTIQERIRLRQEALKQCDPLIINVGKNMNTLSFPYQINEARFINLPLQLSL